MSTWVLLGCAAGAWGGVAALAGRPRPRLVPPPVTAGRSGDTSGPVAHALLCLALGAVAGVVLGGLEPRGVVWGAAAAGVAWWFLRRGPVLAARREDRAVAADLPFLVLLLSAALRSGAAPSAALRLACEACPGAAAERLRPLTARLAWGVDPVEVWDELARDPVLAALGRRLARSHRTGAAVAPAVADLAEELAAERRVEVEDLARGVGVRAALPLGLCLLPAFLLLGIAPVVAGLVGRLAFA